MKELLIIRDEWSNDETLGRIIFANEDLAALERPWMPTKPGGEPFLSCVPAGWYRLRPHTRPNGDRVLALTNAGLAVYYNDADRPSGVGRYLILIHPANWTYQIAGCIAPGLSHAVSNKGTMVTSSRIAMDRIMEYVGNDEAELEIRQYSAMAVAV